MQQYYGLVIEQTRQDNSNCRHTASSVLLKVPLCSNLIPTKQNTWTQMPSI